MLHLTELVSHTAASGLGKEEFIQGQCRQLHTDRCMWAGPPCYKLQGACSRQCYLAAVQRTHKGTLEVRMNMLMGNCHSYTVSARMSKVAQPGSSRCCQTQTNCTTHLTTALLATHACAPNSFVCLVNSTASGFSCSKAFYSRPQQPNGQPCGRQQNIVHMCIEISTCVASTCAHTWQECVKNAKNNE